MSELSLEELEAEIAQKEAELKRRGRAIVAGKASGKARAHSPNVRALRERYLKEGGAYRTIRRLAHEVGLSERHANRVFQDLKFWNGYRWQYPHRVSGAVPENR